MAKEQENQEQRIQETTTPSNTLTPEKPGVHLHQVATGYESKLVMESEINKDVEVVIPNDDDNVETTPEGKSTIRLITTKYFNRLRGEVRDWLNQNMETMSTNFKTSGFDTIFKPKVVDLLNNLKTTFLNDPQNEFPESGYVNDATQEKGILVKLHSVLKTLDNKITKEQETRKKQDDKLSQDLYDHLPIGSLVRIYHSQASIKSIKKWYVRCDGKEVKEQDDPDLYKFLKDNDPRSYGRSASAFWNDLKIYPTVEERRKIKREQLGYLIGQHLREKLGGSLSKGPYIFQASTIMDMIREGVVYDTEVGDSYARYKRSNFPKKFRLRNLLTTCFRHSTFGALSLRNQPRSIYTTNVISRGVNSSVECPVSPSYWGGKTFGGTGFNSIERTAFLDITNIQIYIHKVETKTSTDGREIAHLLHVGVGNLNSGSGLLNRDFELRVWVDGADGSYKSDLLFYLEIGNNANNTITDEYGILIPHEFFTGSEYNDMPRIIQDHSEMAKHYPLGHGSIQYHNQVINGLRGEGYVIQLSNRTRTNDSWIYMSVGGFMQYYGSNIQDSQSSSYYPILHPVLTYNEIDPPMSLFQMLYSNGRRWGWYKNHESSISYKHGPIDTQEPIEGNINRFVIQTRGLLSLVGLNECYTYEQFDKFWDELISSCPKKGWDTNPDKIASTYPRIGGVDIDTLPVCASSAPSGFVNLSPFEGSNQGATGCHFGFRYDMDSNSLGYPIKGSRIVLKVPNMNQFDMCVDHDYTNISNKGMSDSFLMFCNDTWKDLSVYLDKVSSDKKKYPANQLPPENVEDASGLNPREEFIWTFHADSPGPHAYQSEGIVRIRIYNVGSETPSHDFILVGLSTRNQGYDREEIGGSRSRSDAEKKQQKEDARNQKIGYGFKLLTRGWYIFYTPGRYYGDNTHLDVNATSVVVIDRITNVGNTYLTTKGYTDAWDCFNFSWFIDYCNNNEKLINDPIFYVPDLRDEESKKVKTEYYMKAK